MARRAASLLENGATSWTESAADFTVGEALIHPALNRICFRGQTAQVEPKVMQVLMLMAAQPGGVVTRDQFLEAVWHDTGGDDYLLNRAISQLRKIFADDAGAPRYIETIRKSGYRLVASIASAPAAPLFEPVPKATALPGKAPWTLSQRRPQSWGVLAAGIFGFLSIAVLAVSLTQVLRFESAKTIADYEVRPLTSMIGQEVDPALSPDGSRVVFAWNEGDTDTFNLFVKTLDSETLLRLTHDAQPARYPIWSPDGEAIYFARSSTSGTQILRVSAVGGPAVRVFFDPEVRNLSGMSMAPDGRSIVYAGRGASTVPFRLIEVVLQTGARRFRTEPPLGTLGDIDPRYSADGTSIAFVRAQNAVTKDIFIVSQSDDLRRLTFDNRKINGIAWDPIDEDTLLFPSTRRGMYGVWRASVDGGEPEVVQLGGEEAQRPTTAPGVEAIVIERWAHRARLRGLDLGHAKRTAIDPPGASTRWDSNPAFAPTGEHIAFTSNRAGPHGIWISDRDGRNVVEIAAVAGAFLDHPAWSPDGRLIAFDASPEGRSEVFIVSPIGGAARQVTSGPGGAHNPSWSRDSAWIYFERHHDGNVRVFAQAIEGGPAIPVTFGSGANPAESADGAWVLFSKPDQHGLWRTPRRDWSANTPPEPGEVLTSALDRRDGANWVAASDGVYFVRRSENAEPVLSKWIARDDSVIKVLALPPSFEGWGLALSPDELEILYSELVVRDSDLGLATLRR